MVRYSQQHKVDNAVQERVPLENDSKIGGSPHTLFLSLYPQAEEYLHGLGRTALGTGSLETKKDMC